MFCTNCGAENSEEAKYCKHCGESLLTKQIVTNLPKENPKRNNIVLKGVVGIAGIVIFALLVCFGGEFKESNSTLNIAEQHEEQEIDIWEDEMSEVFDEEVIDNELISAEKIEPQIKREEEICYFYHFYDVDRYEGYTINEYDANGNVLYTETDYGKWNYAYDFYQDGTPSAKYTYTLDGTLTYEINYDEHGNITKEESPEYSDMEAYLYQYEYDEKGNIIKKIEYWYIPDEKENVYFLNLKEYSYNENGDVKSETVYYDEAMETPVFTYISEYDENGNLILYYSVDESMPEGMGFKIEYNPALHTKKVYYNINGEGELRISEYTEYNAEGDMVLRTFYDSTGEVTESHQYEYECKTDDKGNIIEKSIYVDGELFITRKREFY